MVKETLSGQMEEDIKGSISGIKKKDMENLHGKMVEYTAANGRMESKKEEVSSSVKTESKEQEYGVTAKKLDGFNEYFIYFISIKS
jgi:hypothetical protein